MELFILARGTSFLIVPEFRSVALMTWTYLTRVVVFINNAHFLCSDGQKMSKRKKNYPDPGAIVQSYGADALR